MVSPEPSEGEQRKQDIKPIVSKAPSIDEVENIELDTEETKQEQEVLEKDSKINGETEENTITGDNNGSSEIDDSKEDEDEGIHLTSVVENPDMRRESIAEIKRLAEGIVQRGDGRGPLCSIDSANINGNEMRLSIDETTQPSPNQQHTSVIITNPSVDLAASGSPASGNGTGIPKLESFFLKGTYCLLII